MQNSLLLDDDVTLF